MNPALTANKDRRMDDQRLKEIINKVDDTASKVDQTSRDLHLMKGSMDQMQKLFARIVDGVDLIGRVEERLASSMAETQRLSKQVIDLNKELDDLKKSQAADNANTSVNSETSRLLERIVLAGLTTALGYMFLIG